MKVIRKGLDYNEAREIAICECSGGWEAVLSQ